MESRRFRSPEESKKMLRLVRFHWLAVAALLAVCAFAVPSFADTQGVSGCTNCGGYTFQATLTPNGNNDYSLKYTITNVSGASADARSWSLTLFNSTNNVGSATVLSVSGTSSNSSIQDYSAIAGKSNNGNGNCNTAIGNAVCVTSNGAGTLSKIGLGQYLTFNLDLTCANCTELANWIFLAQGSCDPGTGNCYAISTTGTPVSVPEPSSPVLLFCSLVAALGMMAIPRVRNIVLSPGRA
jgi:hypothetical protein